jgi:hypothetical protein
MWLRGHRSQFNPIKQISGLDITAFTRELAAHSLHPR